MAAIQHGAAFSATERAAKPNIGCCTFAAP
jgi:hypothetical protein